MLSDDPKKLRFLGIDLRSRGRRRVTVVLTYSFFVVTMAVVQTFFDYHPMQSDTWALRGGFWELIAMLAVTYAFSNGIFRENGPVKPFQPKRQFGCYGNRLVLETRDDWAMYLYEKSFSELTVEQQVEVRRRWRPGKYLVKDKPFFAPGLPDERELAEAGLASRTALGIVWFLLMASSVSFAVRGMNLHADAVTVSGLELAVAVFTLPKAVILWREADPRQYAALEDTTDAARS